VLDVQRRVDVDASIEQLRDVLPAPGVAAPFRVGVCKLVDDDECWSPCERGVEVEFLDDAPVMLGLSPREDLHAEQERDGVALSVVL